MRNFKEYAPAYLDERDCSADFVDYLSDNGSVIWNRADKSEHTGLFFFNNRYVVCKYCSSSNVLTFSFENPLEQIESFIDMLKNDLFKESEDQEILADIDRVGDKVWVCTYFKPEEL